MIDFTPGPVAPPERGKHDIGGVRVCPAVSAAHEDLKPPDLEGPKVKVPRSRMKVARKRALELEHGFYFASKPCIFGHIANRKTPNGKCLECARRNPKRMSANSKRHRARVLADCWHQ